MTPNPLHQLNLLGQAVWLDFISRPLLEQGDLAKLVKQDHLAGVTSNPSIFLNAIAKTNHYDDVIKKAVQAQKRSPEEVYETLVVKDIQDAADILRVVYDKTSGRDGYVSLEVSPHLAHDAQGTIAEGQRLWQKVCRPNLMIKVPGTSAGFLAIKELIACGINVNVTLLFSVSAYQEAAKAYLEGQAVRDKKNLPLDGVHSVASFFISRIDTKIDAKLAQRDGKEAQGLMGKIAIANAKSATQAFVDLYDTDFAKTLAEKGAHPQRLLWASTSSKNPHFKDVYYIESLIGKDTVNTMPLATLDAFRDHGVAAPTLSNQLELAKFQLDALADLGIDFDAACRELLDEGLQLFCDSYDELIEAIGKKLL